MTAVQHRNLTGWRALIAVCLSFLCVDATSVYAAELVMFERMGCAWCVRWNKEVGPIYPKTPEGEKAPLRRVSLDYPLQPQDKLSPPVFYTPTFVLMQDGREVGRITGYMGDDAFWGLLGKMIRGLDQKKASAP